MTSLKIISFKNQKEFDQINLVGKKIVSKYFILIFQKESSDIHAIYLGLKISRKFGNSVKRNKARRRLKHLVRDFFRINQNRELLGSKFLFIPRNSVVTAKYSDLLAELIRLIADPKLN